MSLQLNESLHSELHNLKRKVDRYKEVLHNTEEYRKVWKNSLKDGIMKELEKITNWEDFDDDEPNKRIGFHFNFGQQEEESGEEG